MARVEVFAGPQCKYCVQAKSLLQRRGVDYTEYDVSRDEHMQEFVRRLPRLKALPQIFVNGEHIGSYEDLVIIDGNGRLESMLHTTDQG